MCWSSVSHPPLLQLVKWMDPVYFIFTNNDCVFMTGPVDSNRLIHSSEEETACNLSLGFGKFPTCMGHHNICVLVQGQIWAYILQRPELLLIIWIACQYVLYIF